MTFIDLVILVSIACSFVGGQISAEGRKREKDGAWWALGPQTVLYLDARPAGEGDAHRADVQKWLQGEITDIASNQKVEMQEMREEKGMLK